MHSTPTTTRFDRSAIAYWDARAARWRVAEPLAPGPEDIGFYTRCATRARAERGRPLRVLLLGVTPAIARLPWPADTRLVATDWSAGMIARVWPAGARAALVRADWRTLPFDDAAFDLVVGDGCYSVFPTLEGAGQLNDEVHRVLSPGGRFCIRSFARPARPEGVEPLFRRLARGAFPNLDLFRWLLAMAIQGDSREGVHLRSVWEAWHARVPDPSAHPARAAWTDDAVANLEGWREATSRYVFPTVGELRAAAEARFAVRCERPAYAWGECFPRLEMRRRG